MYVDVSHVYLMPVEAEEGIRSLELESQIVVSHHVGVEN